ncbi:MAG: hypothetical protein HY735_17425 [Verrucomicrobia bacterium]|nr:hypothetical protein [Verrucomicrobiota bacterium]
MSARKNRTTRAVIGLFVCSLLLVAVIVAVLNVDRSDVGRVRKLPDGSTLSLREVALAATNYSYSHRSGGRILRLFGPVLPGFLRSYFRITSGSLGFGSVGNTNLIAITVHRHPAQNRGLAAGRLRVSDDQGNVFDAAWGAGTLGQPDETVQGWRVSAFPRRNRTISLHFLAEKGDGSWTNVADFRVPNPVFANYDQWTPESWPISKGDGNLAVTLGEFQSGARVSGRRGLGDESSAARKTRVVLGFAEDGRPTHDWRVQKLILSDATGNRWFPYLDFVQQDFNWTTNATVEFFGALWPGERAYKLNVEVARKGGFSPDQLWEIPIDLPPLGSIAALTNFWEHDGLRVNLVALASPNAEHAGNFRWIARWWGEDRNRVYSLALRIDPDLRGRRLTVVKALDQDGREAPVVRHGNQDAREQAVFLKPVDGARTVRLTLAVQRSRFVEFLAQPKFVGGE